MAQSSYPYSIALILSCSILFMTADPGLAAVTIPLEPSLSPPLLGFDPAADPCLSSLHSVEGCVQEIITAFFSFKIEFLGNACCKAAIEIEDKCWPKLFPFNPFFPPLIKLHCERITINAPSSTPPAVQQHVTPPSPKIVQAESPPPVTAVADESLTTPSTDDSTGQDESQPPSSEEQDN